MSAQSPNVPETFEQLDQISSAVFVVQADADGTPRYVAFNAHARAISGRPLSDYIGRTAREIYEGAYGVTAFERHCEALRSNQALTYEIELPIDGATRAFRTTLKPHVGPDGQRQVFGTSIDLTDRNSVLQKQVNMDTLTTEMEQFIAMAAHDLRAPMRNVSMLTELLREGFVDRGDGKLELIEMLEAVANKSMNLISDVLSHASAVEATQTRTKFNIGALCRDVCDVMDPHSQHRFTYTQADLLGDRVAFQIGIRNLVGNALKHGRREQMHIDITVQRGEGGMLDVIISDDGKGFSDSALKFINGGAFRVDSGYGLLGLRRMVQARGGTMSASNAQIGEGAVVHLSLPGTWIAKTNSLGDLVEAWEPEHFEPKPKIA